MLKIDIYNSIEGWLSISEAYFLYDAALHAKEGIIVEIGSWKGKSTSCLAMGSLDGNKIKIYAVDPFTGLLEHTEIFTRYVNTFYEFKENMEKYDFTDVVKAYIMKSKHAAKMINEPVDFIFIDGSHNYEDVKLDFQLWFPKLKKGGCMALHDSNWSGPNAVIDEFLKNESLFENVNIAGSITYAFKK
jgi:predicted O-methyltransferase YrrM